MIGRKKERNELEDLYDSGKAELVAIFGRRRVGKTYLINEVFGDRFAFKHTGLSPVEISGTGMLKAQLDHFYLSLKDYGLINAKKPENWLEAFFLLRTLLKQKDTGERQVVFIDELPWLDTQRSGFITGFESFWNGWGASRNNLMVIVCGSATSWMMDRLINNYGGLYGRVTSEIYIAPFSLREVELFFEERGIGLSRYDIVGSYMAVGGIPFYLGYFNRQLSLAQNLDQLFFKPHARLKDEYRRLFASTFINADKIMAIVGILGKKRSGYTRKKIAEKLKVPNNGKLSEELHALISNGFVAQYVPFGYSGKQVHYKLTDPFCLFYIHFMKNINNSSSRFWEENLSSGQVVSWKGYAFENVCFNHISSIKSALSINGINSNESAWFFTGEKGEDGAQIDMLIDRADNIVNLCEMKYYSDVFDVDKELYMKMLHRKRMLEEKIPARKTVINTLITTFGITKNEYGNIFSNVITLDDLFEI